jgi:hypothetical protein
MASVAKKERHQLLQKETNSSNTAHISICDLMKNNSSEILHKIEYQIPTYLQEYTDLFTKYIH